MMATAIPAGPVAEPPTSPLPAIPTPKAKKSLPLPKTPVTQVPIKLRLPSASHRPSALPTPLSTSSSPAIPTLRSASSTSRVSGIPEKTVRKTISIAAFPHPPATASRPTTASSTASLTSLKPRSSDLGGTLSPNPALKKKPSRLSTNTTNSYQGFQTPSLLNSSGDGKSIPSVRISDGQFSIPSPPQSRSSSAQDSYSTSATTFEETEDTSADGRASGGEQRNGKAKANKGNVLVSVRVRPDASGQETSRTDGEWMVDGRRALVAYRGKEGGDYYYDNVFATHDNNAKVYDASAKRLVRRVMEGYHGTVFAYGMTGTGKTFSMQGTATNPGVIPLAITDIFSYIRETPHREFLLRVSYLEIYNEKIHDLLAAPTQAVGAQAVQQEEIKLREDSKRGVYASPLKEEIVQSPTQLLRVIARGDHARRTGSTQWNTRSSRSHAVVQIVVESRERAKASSTRESKHTAMLPGGVRVSTLSLIDLAGSERAAETKERRTEGAHINKSLLTLGTVIARLSGAKDKDGNATDKDGKHLPYRDSKLTRLLQPALSGNSLVSILSTIQIGSQGSAATANSHTGETLNTLKFAARAKNNLVSHAKRAEEAIGSGANAGLLERYRSEIQSLRSQLDGQQKVAAEREERQLEKEAEHRHEEQMLEMQLARTALKERIEHLNRLILCSKSTGVNSTSGTISALGMHSRLSSSTNGELGTRSLRSSASQSTLGANTRVQSLTSLGTSAAAVPLPGEGEDEDTAGEFGDGMASIQSQNRALQSDLQDKTRYIATLEKRLLQARRSSHSRMSMGFSAHKSNIAMGEDAEMSHLLSEKDTVIAELRSRLEDQERTVAALRSAARKRDVADGVPSVSPIDGPKRSSPAGSRDSSSSHLSGNSHINRVSPIDLLSPQKKIDKKKRNVDEVSKMLDEMIQDKVESGHLIKGRSGSVRVVNEEQRPSSGDQSVPALGTMVSALRGSVFEPTPSEA